MGPAVTEEEEEEEELSSSQEEEGEEDRDADEEGRGMRTPHWLQGPAWAARNPYALLGEDSAGVPALLHLPTSLISLLLTDLGLSRLPPSCE